MTAIEPPSGWLLVPVGRGGRCLLDKDALAAVARKGATPEDRQAWAALPEREGWGLLTGARSRAWLGPLAGARWVLVGDDGERRAIHAGPRPPEGGERRVLVVPFASVEEIPEGGGLREVAARAAAGDRGALVELARAAGVCNPETIRAEDGEEWSPVSWPESPPEVPLELAGKDFAAVAARWADLLGVTPTAALLCALTSFSTALAGRVEINCGGGWWERNPALWAFVAMPSGHRKTPLLDLALAPWRSREAARRGGARERLVQAKVARKIAEVEFATAMKDGEIEDAEAAQAILEQALPLDDPSILVESYTPEALSAHLGAKPALFLTTSEAKSIFADALRNDNVNLGALLNSYSGAIPKATLRIGRVQHTSCTSRIRSGLLGLCQPSVLYGIGQRPEFLTEGLLGRALWTVSHRPAPSDRERREEREPGAFEGVERLWARVLDRAFALPLVERNAEGVDEGEPRVWRIGYRSELALLDYADSCKRRGEIGGELHDLNTWLLKAHGQAARLAATLAAADGFAEGEIPAEAVERALALLGAFEAHVGAAWGLAGWPPETDDARHLWASLAGAPRGEALARGAVAAALRGGTDWGPKRLEAALAALEARGFVRLRRTRNNGPVSRVTLNPLAG